MKKLTKQQKLQRKKARRDSKLSKARKRGRRREFENYIKTHSVASVKQGESIIDYL